MKKFRLHFTLFSLLFLLTGWLHTIAQPPTNPCPPITWVSQTSAAPPLLAFSNITPTTTLNWTDNARNEIGYAIYRSDDGGFTYNFITQVPQNINTFTQSILTPSTTSFFYEIAVSEGGESSV